MLECLLEIAAVAEIVIPVVAAIAIVAAPAVCSLLLQVVCPQGKIAYLLN